MLQMRLHPRRPQLSVVPQVLQVLRVLFEMPLQLLALQQLLTQLARARFADGGRGHGAEGAVHAVTEGVHLSHVEVVRFHFVALFALVFADLGQDCFVVLRGWEGRRLVLVVELGRYDEGERHAALAGTCGAANSVRVGLGGCWEVEV